jgi:hypothetical protein
VSALPPGHRLPGAPPSAGRGIPRKRPSSGTPNVAGHIDALAARRVAILAKRGCASTSVPAWLSLAAVRIDHDSFRAGHWNCLTMPHAEAEQHHNKQRHHRRDVTLRRSLIAIPSIEAVVHLLPRQESPATAPRPFSRPGICNQIVGFIPISRRPTGAVSHALAAGRSKAASGRVASIPSLAPSAARTLFSPRPKISGLTAPR